MRRLKVGEKVVALNSSPDKTTQKRVKGVVYTVQEITFCRSCGTQSIKIGTMPEIPTIMHCNCGAKEGTVGYWTASKNFAPIDNIDQAIAEAVEEEDYELAAVLRDVSLEQIVEA